MIIRDAVYEGLPSEPLDPELVRFAEGFDSIDHMRGAGDNTARMGAFEAMAGVSMMFAAGSLAVLSAERSPKWLQRSRLAWGAGVAAIAHGTFIYNRGLAIEGKAIQLSRALDSCTARIERE